MGFRGVDVEGVTLGDSPNAETMLRGMPDFSASTGSLGSGKRLKPCSSFYTFIFEYVNLKPFHVLSYVIFLRTLFWDVITKIYLLFSLCRRVKKKEQIAVEFF